MTTPHHVAADGRKLHLGRVKPKSRPHVLRLSAFLDTVGAVPPPDTVDYSPKATAALTREYLNQTLGDCVIADLYHAFGVWSGNATGTPVLGTDAEVGAAYQTICGPGDNGCNIDAVSNYAQAHGVSIGGVIHKILGRAAVDWRNVLEVKVALYLFGTLTVGVNLPEAWFNDEVWDVTDTAIAGGHDIVAVGYNATGVVVCSWGSLRTITWAAFTALTWVEELYVRLAPDWFNNANLSPTGLDVPGLQAALATISSGGLPPITPTPTPTPTAATTVTLSSSKNPAAAGESLAFTAAVHAATSGPAGPPPTGIVQFNIDGSPDLEFVAVSNTGPDGSPEAVLDLYPGLPQGEHGVVARYNGDTVYPKSGNAILKQFVTPATTPVVAPVTLAQATEWVAQGVASGRPYVASQSPTTAVEDVVEAVAKAAVDWLTSSWPKP